MTLESRGRLNPAAGYAGLAIALLGAVIFGLTNGDVALAPLEVFKILASGPREAADEAFVHAVIWRIRMPRVIVSTIAGAVLAGCGVIFQGALRNPLAEPYTLGVASGAAFGAAAAIVAGLPWVTAASFAGSAAALLLVWFIGHQEGETDAARLILAGVIVGSILGAGLTLMKAIAGDRVAMIVLWLMGGFSAAGWPDVMPLLLSLAVLFLLSLTSTKELDIMASGAEVLSLGVDVTRSRVYLLGASSLAVSFVVSRFGVIGFIGLVVPHLLRLLFGPPHFRLLPLSMLGGGALLCAADTLAKSMNELPVGVLTVLIGGPVFCVLLWKRA